jgi:hypothetical protein
VGTITVQSYTPDLYSPDDVEVVETLAALAAPALSTSRTRRCSATRSGGIGISPMHSP